MAISNRESHGTEGTRLVQALERIKLTGKKSLIKSTDHLVSLQQASSSGSNLAPSSALVEEAVDDEEEEHENGQACQRIDAGQEKLLPRDGAVITLTSWKTQEFAYRKMSKIGFEEDDDLPTLARGLFTCREASGEHRIVVRGYDKFFNQSEMLWTRVSHFSLHSSCDA
jgi:hypothetical protein